MRLWTKKEKGTGFLTPYDVSEPNIPHPTAPLLILRNEYMMFNIILCISIVFQKYFWRNNKTKICLKTYLIKQRNWDSKQVIWLLQLVLLTFLLLPHGKVLPLVCFLRCWHFWAGFTGSLSLLVSRRDLEMCF